MLLCCAGLKDPGEENIENGKGKGSRKVLHFSLSAY